MIFLYYTIYTVLKKSLTCAIFQTTNILGYSKLFTVTLSRRVLDKDTALFTQKLNNAWKDLLTSKYSAMPTTHSFVLRKSAWSFLWHGLYVRYSMFLYLPVMSHMQGVCAMNK